MLTSDQKKKLGDILDKTITEESIIKHGKKTKKMIEESRKGFRPNSELDYVTYRS